MCVTSNLDESPGAGLNRRPRPYQGRALPTELPGHTSRWLVAYDSIRQMEMLSDHLLSAITVIKQIGAGNGTRTRDPELGRLALYQLSYSRKQNWWRGKDSNLRRHSRQIYSLLPLATRASIRKQGLSFQSWRWDSNPRPPDYKSGALPVELRQQDCSCSPGGRSDV